MQVVLCCVCGIEERYVVKIDGFCCCGCGWCGIVKCLCCCVLCVGYVGCCDDVVQECVIDWKMVNVV